MTAEDGGQHSGTIGGKPLRQLSLPLQAMDAARKGTCLPGAVDEASKLPGRMTEGRFTPPFVQSFVACHTELASVMRLRAWPLDVAFDMLRCQLRRKCPPSTREQEK